MLKANQSQAKQREPKQQLEADADRLRKAHDQVAIVLNLLQAVALSCAAELTHVVIALSRGLA